MDNIRTHIARHLLSIGAVFLRPDEPFVWASGIKSPIYCDNRLILTAPEARNEVEQAITDTVRREYPEAQVLMGTATAGIAHAAIAAHLLGLPMGYVRSGSKDHGRRNQIEGKLTPGERVVVIEDLISTGGSVLDTVAALRAAGAEVLGVIITGEGKGFVAGADISQMNGYGAEEGRNYANRAQTLFNKIEGLEKPVIAAVNGYALGGGCELSMSCDIRIASEKAVFGQPEVNLGLVPCFGGTQRLSRLVGTGIAKEMIFTARQIKADEAKAIGLVNKVVAPEALLDEAKAMMGGIISKAPMAVRYAKVAINKGVNMDLMNGLELEKDVAALAFASEDAKEGTAAFLAKRPAVFQNK